MFGLNSSCKLLSQLNIHHISGNYSSHHAPEQNTVFSYVTSTEPDDVMQLQRECVCVVCVGRWARGCSSKSSMSTNDVTCSQSAVRTLLRVQEHADVFIGRDVVQMWAGLTAQDDVTTKEQMFNWKWWCHIWAGMMMSLTRSSPEPAAEKTAKQHVQVHND